METNLIDISLPLYPGMITYPGNTELEITIKKSPTSVSSEIIIGSHAGTHIDAPAHVFPDGLTIDKLLLDIFIGPCRVLDMTRSGTTIEAMELEKKNIQSGERLLLKTNNSLRGFQTFYDDFVYLSGDAAEYLAEKRIKLIGIDSLSMKQKGSQDLRPHNALLTKNIPLLEGINLASVDEGQYKLIALPLRFMGIDGSPARALLEKI